MGIRLIKQFLETRKNKLILILFFGLLIRIYNLGNHNLWFDEVIPTNFNINLPYNRIPHLYYILLKSWVICFGKSEFVLRAPSLIFGVLSIILIYKLGKSFFNTKTGLVSAFILSISPLHIWYSQEARQYGLLTFLIMLIVYFFISALKKNKVYLWIIFIVSSILNNLDYLYFVIIILLGSLFFLKSYRPLLKHYLLSLSLIFFISSLSPFLSPFLQKLISIKNNFWIPKPHPNSMAITFENFNVGYNATPWIYFFTFMVFSLLFILGIKTWWQEKRGELVSLILFVFIPIIFTYLISQIIPIYLDKRLMAISPFYYIIIAAGLAKIKMRIIKTTAYLSIIVPILICLHNYFSYSMPLPKYHHEGTHVKKPVKPAIDYINTRFKKGDAVGFSETSSVGLVYYMPKLISEKIDIFVFIIKSKLDRYWRKMGEERGYGIYYGWRIPSSHVVILDEEPFSNIKIKNLEEYNFKRLWLISSSWSRDGLLNLHAQAIRQWMQNRYSIIDTKEFDGIFVELYTKKIQ